MTSEHVLDPLSRRTFLATTGGLLAGFTLTNVLPAEAGGVSSTDLALYRPVQASSTAYAATPPQFVVDNLPLPGVKGSGWRAASADPQWITVDLQATCRIEAVKKPISPGPRLSTSSRFGREMPTRST